MTNFPYANALDEIYKSISPEPLLKKEEFEAYYRPEINELRGTDKIALINLELGRAYAGLHYKGFLMGHSGVGKSTELTRLVNLASEKYRTHRLSATSELDPIQFQPFDVLLLIVADIVEKTGKPIGEGGAGTNLSDTKIQNLWDWFASEKETQKKATEITARMSAGMGLDPESMWAKALGLFASFRGEAKFAGSRTKETIAYRLSRLSDLIEIANGILDECNQHLKKQVQKEWLVIGEDFDKAGIPPEQVENLFVTYSNLFKSLRCHMIFVIPIALGYSSKADQFHVGQDRLNVLPDTPVFDQDHKPHEGGRKALHEVLKVRMDLDLFDGNTLDRFVVACGGNLRDLFAMVTSASNLAVLREGKDGKVREDDAEKAINEMRTEYERRLGENPYESPTVSYEQKTARLKELYDGKASAGVPGPTLYSLLRSRAVQEFNGKRWFGIHPLVVDVLAKHDAIPTPKQGVVPGGTI